MSDAVKRGIVAIGAVLAGVLLVLPTAGGTEPLSMLDQLDHGDWLVRIRGEGARTESLCLGSGRSLIQLRHRDLECSQVIVEDRPQQVVVQYTCRGQGYGRTSIRRESAQLVQIDSQGIAQGLPFAFAAEARRVGSCHS